VSKPLIGTMGILGACEALPRYLYERTDRAAVASSQETLVWSVQTRSAS